MRLIKNIISFVFLFCSISSLPAGEDNNNSHIKKDLSQLVSGTYRSPKNENGHAESENRLKRNTNITLLSNPEEDGGRDVLPRDTASRSGVRDKCMLWNNAEIPYFIESTYSTKEYDMIFKAMRTLQFWTCIKFVSYEPSRYIQPDYVIISRRRGKGCRSYLGRVGGGQELNLDPLNCFDNMGSVLHELLHTIGVIDEHRRPDRDDFITVNLDAIIPSLRENFEKDDDTIVQDYHVPYDYNSVMQYDEYAGSKNGTKTMVPKRPIDTPLGQTRGLSVRDAMKVMKMYSCSYNKFNVTEEKPFSRVMPNYGESTFSKHRLYSIYYMNQYT